MFCEHPRGRYPCNKCRACRLRQANEKMIISIFAANEFKAKGQFLTLTYNDEHLPNGLQHSDFAGFMKRLRKNTGVKNLKMFMAGEYGSLSHREHFHVLFYNYKFPIEEIEKAWIDPQTKEPLGFVYDGTLSPQSMKYVSGYISKKGYEPDSGKRPPYGRSSCNLPDNLTGDEIVKMCNTGKIGYNGRQFAVPRNWRIRYKSIWQHFAYLREEMRFERIMEAIRQAGGVFEYWSQQPTPEFVSAAMDEREKKFSLRRKKKCRIM